MASRLAVFLVLLLPGFSAANNDYMQQQAMAVSASEAVDASDYQSGLALNPDGPGLSPVLLDALRGFLVRWCCTAWSGS